MYKYELDLMIEIPGRTINIITMDSSRFFVGDRSNVEYCRWTTTFGGSISGGPTLEKGMVYFGACDQYVYAVDGKTGKEKWRFRTDGDIWTSCHVWDSKVIFGSWDCNIYALDARTGKEKWRFETSVKTKSVIENLDRMPMVAPEVERVIREEVERRDEALEKDVSEISESTYSARIEYVFKDIYGAGKNKYEEM